MACLAIATCVALLLASPPPAQPQIAAAPSNPMPRITGIQVRAKGDGLQLEITTSTAPTVRRSRLTQPDRLVFDFPGLAGPTQRIAVGQKGVIAVRAAMYQVDPPIARLVVDVSEPVQRQLQVVGSKILIEIRTVMLGSPAQRPMPATAPGLRPRLPHVTISESPAHVRLGFSQSIPKPASLNLNADGMLTVTAERNSLLSVLQAIADLAGAQIEPADEHVQALLQSEGSRPVTVKLGPASPRDIIASLLQGSAFDYIVIESPKGQLGKILLAVNPDFTPNSAPVPASNAGSNPSPSNIPSTAEGSPAAVVDIVAPTAGSVVAGQVTITATIQSPLPIAGVQFAVDSTDVGPEITQEPYELIWDTTPLGPGEHRVTAAARDAHGNVTFSSPIIITVAPAN